LGDPGLECTKAPRCGADYQSKISGPLMDRIDIITDVPAVNIRDLDSTGGEDSATVAIRVAKARAIQTERFKKLESSIAVNAHADGKTLESIAPLDEAARALLNKVAESARLSARGYFRVVRVARTIADLSGAPDVIGKNHIAEALSYRRHVVE
jgi:magnesium chelatase family protein